jgi:hypothetical protein
MSEQIHFFTDEHILAEAVKQLRKKGVQITTCQEVGLLREPDPIQLAYAAEHQ